MGNELAIANLLQHYTEICDIDNGKKYFKKLKSIDHVADELDDYSDMLYNQAICYEKGKEVKKDIAKAIEFYNHAADLGYRKAMEYLFDYKAQNCLIEPDKFVIIGVGCGAGNILYGFGFNENSEKCVTVEIGHDLHFFKNYPANVNIHLKAKYGYDCRSIADKEFAKITNFINYKLDKSQRVIVVGHGGGDSRDIFQFVVSEMKKRGRDFKVILPTPFSWEGKRRLDLTQEVIEYFEGTGINAELFDYNKVLNGALIGTIPEAFRAGNHFIIQMFLSMIENWQY